MSREVFLASPCDIAREGIAMILANEGFNVVGAAEDVGSALLTDYSSETIFLIDTPDADQRLAGIERLTREFDSPTIIILATSFDLNNMLISFRAGARGFIIKSPKAAPMIAAIKLAITGEMVLPSDILDLFENQSRPIPALPDVVSDFEDANLSPREHDVLCCLMAGFSNKVIARELDVCEATVKVHVKAILRKLNVNNRTQAAIWGSSHSNEAGFLHWQASQHRSSAQAS